MTQIARSFEQLRRANPVPDPAALRRELQGQDGPVTDTWRMEMTNITVDTEPRRADVKRRRWLPAAVTAALLLAVGIPLALYLPGGAPFAQPSATDIAERYMAARAAYDAEGMTSLVAEDVEVFDAPPFEGTEALQELAALEEVARNSFSDISCAPFNPESLDGWVTCSFLWDSRFHAVGGQPPTALEILIVVEDEQISRVVLTYPEHVTALFIPWINFLAEAGVRDRMVRSDGQGPLLTPESVELHEEYLRLFEEQAGP